MKSTSHNKLAPVLFMPHGGGPLPLLGDAGHSNMIKFIQEITPALGTPTAIVLISAHWEESVPTITSGQTPSLIYDYYGFPDEAYRIQYPAPGNPALAKKILALLESSGIDAKLDPQRGFDHGLYVPLKLMYPATNIPCVQLSLVNSLDPELHIKIGRALSPIRYENILIIGSGFSFHNLRVMLRGSTEPDPGNIAFEHWLVETCTNTSLSEAERARRLVQWQQAPSALHCHPRSEHLLPLHVCYGLGNAPAKLVFNDTILHTQTSAYLW